MQEINRLFYLFNVTEINSTVHNESLVTYIRPDILIFTGVIHKEGNTSDNFHETFFLQNVCCKVSNHMLSIMVDSLN